METNINQLATRAHEVTKPGRKRAFELVAQIASHLNETDNGKLSKMQIDDMLNSFLAELYAYTMPAMPKRPKTADQWVMRAVGKNGMREYLKYGYAFGSDAIGARFAATDGHRLHINHGSLLPLGYYDNAFNRVDITNAYPNIDSVIPEKGNNWQMDVEDFEQMEIIVDGKDHVIMCGEYAFNRPYIMDAIAYFDRDEKIEILQENVGPESCQGKLKLWQGDLTAVIMPRRLPA